MTKPGLLPLIIGVQQARDDHMINHNLHDVTVLKKQKEEVVFL